MLIQSNSVEVFCNPKGKALRSLLPFKVGDLISVILGTVVDYNDPKVDYRSLQIDVNKYLIVEKNSPEECINHSCDPNCQILFENDRIYLYVIKDIVVGDELTFNYNSTEYDMGKDVLVCLCESPNCVKEVKGYKYLTEEQKSLIASQL